MERSGYASKVVDKISIKVAKFNKDLNISINLREMRASFRDYFEYLVLFFNLINASAIFQVYINHALYNLVDNFCIVYLDNILIFLKIKEEHY